MSLFNRGTFLEIYETLFSIPIGFLFYQRASKIAQSVIIIHKYSSDNFRRVIGWQ